jgi:hypothetical protein
MGDYLGELGAAFPMGRDTTAFQSARDAADRLELNASIDAALDLSSALSSLADWFEATRPEAILVPESLAGTSEAKRQRAEIEATFGRLETALGSPRRPSRSARTTSSSRSACPARPAPTCRAVSAIADDRSATLLGHDNGRPLRPVGVRRRRSRRPSWQPQRRTSRGASAHSAADGRVRDVESVLPAT